MGRFQPPWQREPKKPPYRIPRGFMVQHLTLSWGSCRASTWYAPYWWKVRIGYSPSYGSLWASESMKGTFCISRYAEGKCTRLNIIKQQCWSCACFWTRLGLHHFLCTTKWLAAVRNKSSSSRNGGDRKSESFLLFFPTTEVEDVKQRKRKRAEEGKKDQLETD